MLPPSALGRQRTERGLALPGTPQLTIHTSWDHGQLQGPAPVVTTSCGPYFEPGIAIHLREADAALIVYYRSACPELARRLLKAEQMICALLDLPALPNVFPEAAAETKP